MCSQQMRSGNPRGIGIPSRMTGTTESKTGKLPQSLLKALLAGLAGGLAGAAAKLVVEHLVPPRPDGQTPPPKIAVVQAEQATGSDLPPTAETAAASGMHWAFGTLAGGVYGIAAEFEPRVTGWHGAGFGLTLNKLMHKKVLPRAGMTEAPSRQPMQERISEWLSHAAYGLATETVRGIVRKRL